MEEGLGGSAEGLGGGRGSEIVVVAEGLAKQWYQRRVREGKVRYSMDTLRRVKVYKLIDSAWEDQGTGYVHCFKTKRSSVLIVRSEEAGNSILESAIPSSEDTFVKQEDTLIVWNELHPDGTSLDLALSFQEASGCELVWNEIREIQQVVGSEEVPDLPPVNLQSIDELVKLLESPLQDFKSILANSVLRHGYIPKLIDLFEMVRDLQSKEDLVKLFYIFKGLFMLNSKSLIETLLSSEYVFQVMEVLEYDPGVSDRGQIKHSEFLMKKAIFKEVIPLEQPHLIEKIHENYRLQYLKDVVLAHCLDDSTFSVITTMLSLNSLDILGLLTVDPHWIHTFFMKMRTSSTDEELKDQLAFLYEIFELLQKAEEEKKAQIHLLIVEAGLFRALQNTIQHVDYKIRLLSADILFLNVQYNPLHLRNFILVHRAGNSSPLFHLLISRMDTDPESGMKILLMDILQRLLDNIVDDNTEDKQLLLNIFYSEYAWLLFSPLVRPLPETYHTEVEVQMKGNLCDLLSSFVDHHQHRIKNFIIQHDLVGKVFVLLGAKEKHLTLAAIRFLRRLVGAPNYFYTDYIIEKDLFRPVVNLFISNGERNNLLNSTILEMFQFISMQKIKPLIKYYVENFHKQLQDITYVRTFKDLLLVHENSQEQVFGQLQRSGTEELDADSNKNELEQRFAEQLAEESWFDEGDDEDHETHHFSRDADEGRKISFWERSGGGTGTGTGAGAGGGTGAGGAGGAGASARSGDDGGSDSGWVEKVLVTNGNKNFTFPSFIKSSSKKRCWEGEETDGNHDEADACCDGETQVWKKQKNFY
eukprot:TRINITY_DN1767_c0_g3_i25.p1 TRINITY_DN1767_c0_g3~~TRINITY_DN1767_c0_g3_i25.p1  ORF type:complete len:813 (-),score=200.84 TRINITY_DN1767_c0_g3_i25:142-2580(-)